MCRSFVPFAHAQNIYEIDISFYKKLNIKTLFIDLDNTLDSYKLSIPTEKSRELIKKIIDSGITPIIVSNNRGKRVSSYANNLGVEYMANTRKPFSYKIRRQLKEHNLVPDDVLFIGDQMMTDVLAAKGAKLRVVLTEKLVKEDQFTTHINRLMDRPIRAILRKRNKLIDWRKI